MPFYAQHGEDQWFVDNLARFGLDRPGVFVDVGASEGLIESNTAWLERERDWTGLCIDADPRVIADLRKNRTCRIVQCAVGQWNPWQKFPLHPNQKYAGLLRTEGAVIEMPVLSLNEVLVNCQMPSIDILSIDTEGTELEVWHAFSPEHWKPTLVIIEWDTMGFPDRREEISAAVTARGYRLATTLGANLIFARNK